MEAFRIPSPSPPASGDVVAPVDLQLQRLARGLENEFPSVPRTRVRELLETAYDQTRDAVIQTFRPILAERKVREALRNSVSADPAL